MKEQVKRIVEGHKAIRGLSPDRDFLVGMIENMQTKIEELEKDSTLSKILRGTVFGVLEGHNIPYITRKVLEKAYYSEIDVFAEDSEDDSEMMKG